MRVQILLTDDRKYSKAVPRSFLRLQCLILQMKPNRSRIAIAIRRRLWRCWLAIQFFADDNDFEFECFEAFCVSRNAQ